MAEERRVRFTDDYVPGPKGCPVWGIEEQWTFSVPVFIRAETEEEAYRIYREYNDSHPGELEQMMRDTIKADNYHGVEFTSWYHLNPDKGWKE